MLHAFLLVAPSLSVGGAPLRPGTVPGLLEGEPLRLRIDGAAPEGTVVVHAFRVLSKYTDKGPVDVPMHAWAEFRVGRDGTLDVDAARPLRGSYRRPSGLALLWSECPAGDPSVPIYARRVVFAPPKGEQGTTRLVLEEDGRAMASGSFRLVGPRDLAFVRVHEAGLDGVFAYPKGPRRLPTLITLHGSEGGSIGGAYDRAGLFAGEGFATLALNYFASGRDAIPGVPTDHAEIPVETLARAREWLAARSEADVDRLGLYGVSKGAEFAVLAAATYPWVRAAVALVPSDVVWEGYRSEGGGSGGSSWSLAGKPLPYVPLFPLEAGRYRINTDRYERSRRAHPAEARAAEIPIERSKARFLLMGGERDETWASGAQVRRLAARMARAGKGDDVTAVVFPGAGHQLSGTGTFPLRLYFAPAKDRRDRDLVATGEATEEAWRRTVAFLRRNL